jgi:hypothetical protein
MIRFSPHISLKRHDQSKALVRSSKVVCSMRKGDYGQRLKASEYSLGMILWCDNGINQRRMPAWLPSCEGEWFGLGNSCPLR